MCRGVVRALDENGFIRVLRWGFEGLVFRVPGFRVCDLWVYAGCGSATVT